MIFKAVPPGKLFAQSSYKVAWNYNRKTTAVPQRARSYGEGVFIQGFILYSASMPNCLIDR